MRNAYIIDWPLLKKWTNESHHSGIRLALFIVWCVLLVGSLVFAILSIVANMYTNVLYFVLIALFSFYRAFLWNIMIAKQQYKRFAQTYGKNSWLRTIDFVDNEIIIKEEKTTIIQPLIIQTDEQGNVKKVQYIAPTPTTMPNIENQIPQIEENKVIENEEEKEGDQ